MSNRDDLIRARSAMLSVLDEKLKEMPEWRAFREIQKAIMALGNSTASRESVTRQPNLSPRHQEQGHLSYANLAHLLLEEAGEPLASSELIPAIAQRRGVDPAEKKIVISTSLSKDERIKNIPWKNGTAWWHADRPVPGNGHDAKETQPRQNTSGSRAPRGSVDALIKRVLTERGSQGAAATEIYESAHEKVSYSGVRFALDRGREGGLYQNEGGRWFLKGAGGTKTNS